MLPISKILTLIVSAFDPLQCLRKYLGIIDEDPIIFKSNRFCIDIFQFFFMKLVYIP
jgi:hypothetical protein